MRIIAGQWRGRKLVAPKTDATRPTADRTRETLFSMLTSRLGSFEGLSVADLFAGTGALGLEALSRGAGHCLFVEEEDGAARALRANIDTLAAASQAKIVRGSVLKLGPAREAYDLILLDPPYGTGAGCVALDRLLRLGWIGRQTWIALETGLKEVVEVNDLVIDTQRKVGKAKLTLMTKAR
ncbi:MAG: 16S rRNA (guanine(966)-N(2))-methyltransferase RsmD [Erythrobacter sp. RIFCSPHIGHO2_12_FULL_63_10]|nr:MAG: 16S rRNA (guanine(966)-N(2))-methyltransferase RsmD [Erythrobacter sp. RIFCSPHIGHO2_12_FULL_63_10]